MKLALAILLLATNAHALTATLYTDSKMFAGYPGAANVAAYLGATRTDYTWTYLLLPGRDTADTADLVAHLASSSPDVVGIDLAVNDPINIGAATTPQSTVDRLVYLCDLVRADGADCVLFTPMHAPAHRGLVLDHQQWTQEVADLLLASDETVIDIRSALDVATWQFNCMDVYGVHPNNAQCRQILADYAAGYWP